MCLILVSLFNVSGKKLYRSEQKIYISKTQKYTKNLCITIIDYYPVGAWLKKCDAQARFNKTLAEVHHMNESIHDYDRRLELVLRKVKTLPISERNRQIILRFKDECFSQGLSKGRVIKYMYYLLKLSEWLGKDFDKADKQDIKTLVSRIEESPYVDSSKRELKICVKKLYKWLRESDDYPEEVKWIRPSSRKTGKIKLPEEILTEEDVKKLISVASNPRDRAFIAMLYESGCRIGEMLFLRIKHIAFDRYGAQIRVNGKTGPRRIRIISSVPYLTEWLNKHPDKDNPDSYVWLGSQGLIGYNRARYIIKSLGKKAGIKKRLHPHIFRHSRATHLANHLTEAQMKEFFGWVQGSDMASIYIHLSGRDVDNALLSRVYGLKEVDKAEDKHFLPRACPRCGETNPPTNNFCSKCGMVLDEKTMVDIIKRDEERSKADRILDELIKDGEFRSMFLRKLQEISAP